MKLMKRAAAKEGFTVIEVLMVALIIGLLAALAMPSYMRYRASARQCACINNLRQIDSAKDQWSLENRADEGDGVSGGDLMVYLKNNWPTCPAGGQYAVGAIGQKPTCNINGHQLP